MKANWGEKEERRQGEGGREEEEGGDGHWPFQMEGNMQAFYWACNVIIRQIFYFFVFYLFVSFLKGGMASLHGKKHASLPLVMQHHPLADQERKISRNRKC